MCASYKASNHCAFCNILHLISELHILFFYACTMKMYLISHQQPLIHDMCWFHKNNPKNITCITMEGTNFYRSMKDKSVFLVPTCTSSVSSGKLKQLHRSTSYSWTFCFLIIFQQLHNTLHRSVRMPFFFCLFYCCCLPAISAHSN